MKTKLIKNVFVTNELQTASAADIAAIQDFAKGNGSVMRRLLAGNMDMRSLRTNDLLRKDEWKELDAAVVEIASIRLRPIEILRQRGLIKPLKNLGTLLSQYEAVTDMNDAEVSMSAATRAAEDSVGFELVSVPIPVISKGFRIDIRRLLASRNMGEGVDVTQARTATRKVSEKCVDMLFNGHSGRLDGNILEGLTTAANRNTVSGSDWGTATNIKPNVLTAITALQGDRMYGPYGMFVATAQYNEMLADVSATDRTPLQRVLEIPGMQFVEPADQLAAGSAVLFQLTSDVIDIAIAQDIIVVQWDGQGGLEINFKVLAAMAPRPKNDADDRSGIAHISGI